MALEIVHGEDPIEDQIEDAVVVNESGELAVGLKVPTSVKTPVSYLDGLRKYKDIYNDIYKQMEVCNKLYRYNSIIGNAVDVLIDFAVTDVRPEPTGNKKFDKILEHWFENVNETNSNTLPGIYPLSQEIALEWFTSGNAFPYNKWDNVKIENAIYKIPMNVHLINPQSIEIPDGPIAFGQEVIYLKYDTELITKILQDGRSSPESALIKQAIPRTVLNALKSSKMRGSEGIRLNPKYITHLKRRAKGYQAWGVPYLTRVLSSSSVLERLRELDESVAAGLLNLITIFKVGTEEHPASNARLKQVAALLANPKATTTLVWAHDIDILQVGPDGKVLAFKDKYKDAKEDILISLGVPPGLMSLNQTGDAWVSILSLIERLSYWRKITSLWIEKTCNQIGEYNGFKQKVKVKWSRMNLTDESSVKNLVLSFYDRGLISIGTSLEESGYSIDKELEKKKVEEPFKEKFTKPDLPFSGNQEVEKGRPEDNDETMKLKTKKKDDTKTEQTVNLKEQKKRSKPKVK